MSAIDIMIRICQTIADIREKRVFRTNDEFFDAPVDSIYWLVSALDDCLDGMFNQHMQDREEVKKKISESLLESGAPDFYLFWTVVGDIEDLSPSVEYDDFDSITYLIGD